MEADLWGVEGGWVCNGELQTGERGQGPRKDHRSPIGLELQAWGDAWGVRGGERDCTLGTEEGTEEVGPQAKKRKGESWDPWLRKVTDEPGLS